MASAVPILIDNGSGLMKAGCTGDEEPKTVFPTVFAETNEEGRQKCYIGEGAWKEMDKETLKYPIERGLIKNWDQVERIWSHIIHEKLKKTPQDHPIFLTEPAFNEKESREKMVAIVFEKFQSPATYLGIQSVLSLYSYGRTSGVVVDSGYGATKSVPVYEGFCMPAAVKSMNVAGQDINAFLSELLQNRGIQFHLPGDAEMVNDIKEKLCYVTKGFEEEKKKTETEIGRSYQLPDGKAISVQRERFECPELLFRPHLNGLSGDGIQKITYDAVEGSGHKELYSNIVLSGGSSMFEGIKQRIEKEILDLTDRKQNVKVHTHEARRYFSFIGASILTALSTFDPLWVKKGEYEEYGASVVQRKIK